MRPDEPTPFSTSARDDVDPRRLIYRPDQDSRHAPYTVPTLSTVNQIGLMGDLHGDIQHALNAFKTFADRGVTCILQLGDFGILWPGSNWQRDLRKISGALARHHMAMYFVEGNHDFHPKILQYPVDADGVRWLTANVGHLPRGYRTDIGGKFTLAALGGANSIDRRFREEGVSWWPEEQITEADLRRLGSERVDVLVGHDAPLMDEHDLDRRAQDLGFSPADIDYAAASRVMIRRAVLHTRPQLTLGGHYHRFYDQTLALPRETHLTRVVVLDRDGKDRVNLAILTTGTLELEFLHRNGAPAEPESTAPDRTHR